ncbi:tumor necrosis factor receptor-associated factor 3 [Apostichopus japonicus]|uniref:Tumor necrosis factor receptor-associated factor 3 n=1 Tax=Stichopus japonicus TaxID=307972 RepID=A0A2G8JLK7_STIJA|nr:tumor necrosis factor receptor-associated factor 3 [Apostichopus japonicus]
MANECPRRSLPCHLCQQLVGQTELELENHLKNDCPEGNVECYFKVWGCEYTGPRKSLNEHLKAQVDYHYGTVGTEVAKLKTVVTELQETAQDLRNEGASSSPSSEGVAETVDKLNERMKKLQLTMVQKFDKIGKLEKAAEQTAKKTDVQKEAARIDTIASQTTTLANRIQKLEEKSGQGLRARKGGATQQSLEQRVSTLENQISLHAMRLAEHDVRFQVHGTTSYNGSLVWKIKDYARRKRDADSGKTLSLYSQPFFSSRYGFKMCARVYLNGDGIGKDSHMSLFFVIMKGDYDSLLSWPFKQKVTLMLLDQGGGQRHLSDSFRPDPTSSSFQKPTAEITSPPGVLVCQPRRFCQQLQLPDG